MATFPLLTLAPHNSTLCLIGCELVAFLKTVNLLENKVVFEKYNAKQNILVPGSKFTAYLKIWEIELY